MNNEDSIIKNFQNTLLREAIKDKVLDKITLKKLSELPSDDKRIEKFNEYLDKTLKNYLLNNSKNSKKLDQACRLIINYDNKNSDYIREKYNILFKLFASKLGFEDIDYKKYLSLPNKDKRKIAITKKIQE